MKRVIYASIDLFKFLAAILVVAIHAIPFAYDDDLNYYFTCFCRIAVPYFFIATSFFFFSKEKPDIKKYTKRLALLYAAWFVIELPFVYNRFFVDYDHPLPSQLFNFFRCLVFSNTWFASWFIMASILSVNIIYILSRRLNNKQLLLIGWGGYSISLACSSYSGVLDIFLNDSFTYYHAAFSSFFMPANSFVVALIYIVIGKIIAENLHRTGDIHFNKSLNLMLLLLVGILGLLEVHFLRWSVVINDAFLFLPFFTTLSFVLVLHMEVNLSASVSRLLRSMSILVYILHPIFISINHKLFDLDSGLKLFFVTLFESIAVAGLIIGLSSKLQMLKKLY